MEKEFQRWKTAKPNFYAVSKARQKELKANATPAEKKLWEAIRNRKLEYKFRRQHIIDVFIVDFVCLEKKLVIELDGKIHEFQKDYDSARTLFLNEVGFEVIRFKNERVLSDIVNVLKEISVVLTTLPPPTPPKEGS